MKVKILTVFLCALMLLNITAFAQGKTKITIENTTAHPNDTVWLETKIENNVGICAVTVSFNYDASALEYIGYKEGVFSDYSLEAHPNENIVSLVILENKNVTSDGTFITLGFKVLESAKEKRYPISIEYSSGDFSNSNAEIISPEIISGSITVTKNIHEENESSQVSESSTQSLSSNSSSSSSITSDSQSQNTSPQSSSQDSSQSASSPVSSVQSDTSLQNESSASSKEEVTQSADSSSQNSEQSSENTEIESGREKEDDTPLIPPILLIPIIAIPLVFLFIIILIKTKK